MKKIILKYSICIALLGLSQYASAQAPGSESVYGGSTSTKSIMTGGTSSDISESVYIGPGTHLIDGTWEIYAKYVVIDPLAVITGTGTIQFYNPSVAGGAASATLIDGNAPVVANNIDVNMELHNASGMQLQEIPFGSDLIIDGWMNNTISSTVYVGKDLSLAVDGADVTLGTGVVGDLRFDADATISNYRPERMVIVNNSILSHMVKESFTSAFTFPVGIADGDYTPAQITNTSSNTVRVSVQDYTASTSPEATADPGPGGIAADGMRRTWHIFGDAAGTGTLVNLQHNATSNQSGFTDASHFVTQWGAATPNTSGDYTVAFSSSSWQSNTPAAGTLGALSTAGTVAGSSVRSRNYAALATSSLAEESYYTKSSDPFHPLPIALISFEATTKECDVLLAWKVGTESDVANYRVQHSVDGRQYTAIGTIAPNGANSSYSFVHQSAAKGLNLYRLEIVSNDGSYTISEVAKVNHNCEVIVGNSVTIYPNPASEQLQIVLQGSSNNNRFELIDALGRVLLQGVLNNNTNNKLDVSGLVRGTYLVKVITDDNVTMHQVQILK